MTQASRLEKKLATCINAGEYYEAHQIYRTLYFRLSGQSKFEDLLALLYSGSLKLIECKEFASGIDLCELFADTLVKAKTIPSSDVYDQLEQLIRCMPSHLPSDKEVSIRTDRRNKFIATSVKWSREVAKKPRERKRGASELHFRMANVFWAEKNYETARNHFILSERPESFAAFLVEMHETMGFSSEADMFVALAVLQLLCLHRVRTASCLLQQYTEIHPSLQATRPPYQKPLLNFLWLLMLTIPKRNVSYFSILVEKYHISIGRDPNYKTYLDKIGQLFFGLQAPSNMSSMGIFGSLIRGMLGNDKKEEEEVFSDSDMDTDSGSNRMEIDEDGYETAEDTDVSPLTHGAELKNNTIDHMDDLD